MQSRERNALFHHPPYPPRPARTKQRRVRGVDGTERLGWRVGLAGVWPPAALQAWPGQRGHRHGKAAVPMTDSKTSSATGSHALARALLALALSAGCQKAPPADVPALPQQPLQTAPRASDE